MIDKELEAIYKCHEYLQDLDNDSRMRVFKYLLDRYGIVNTNSFQPNKRTSQDDIPKIENIIPEVLKKEAQYDKKNNTTGSVKKSKPSSSQSYSLVTSLNLVSKGKISLKDYFNKYITKNNFEYNIVILSYLKNESNEDNVGINHIYTCYKHLAIKIPNIRQSLVDTKNRKGWIETANTDDLQITVAGENFIDHEINKA